MKRSLLDRIKRLEGVRWQKPGNPIDTFVILQKDETFEQYVERMIAQGYDYDPDEEYVVCIVQGGADDIDANGAEFAALPHWERHATKRESER